MSKLLIFDADSMVFTVAYRFRDKKAKHLVTMNLNKYILDVIKNSGATHYIGFYGSKEDGAAPNFRFDIFPDYKANRPPTPEWVLKWRPTLHAEMKNKWSFMPIEGMEADDAASVAANYYKDEYDEVVIATEDKDLKTVPNISWYNLKKHTMEFISEDFANKRLAIQTLSGDPTDNIPGLPGIGPVKAENIVKDCTTVRELQVAVIQAYRASFNALLAKLKVSNTIVTEEDLTAEYEEKGMKLSSKQIQRKLKMLNKGAGDEIYNTFPGGWKAFLKFNHSLVRMLVREDELPPNFDMPEPVESTFTPKSQDNEVVEDARKVLFGDSDDGEEDDALSEFAVVIESAKPTKVEKINTKIEEKIEIVAPVKEVIVLTAPVKREIMSL